MNGVDLADLIELIEEKVDWHPDAAAEFRALPIEMRLDVLQQLTRITINLRQEKVWKTSMVWILQDIAKCIFGEQHIE